MSELEAPTKKKSALDEAELQLKQLEIQAKQLELQDLQDRIDERKLVRENKSQNAKSKGRTLSQAERDALNRETRCNHRKGGNGADGIVSGQGDDPQYAVIKHRMTHGDFWIKCLRCSKTWKPPVESQFYFDQYGKLVAPKDGKFDAARFAQAQLEYKEALAFQTRNVASGSIVFTFSDGGKKYREETANINLR